MKSTNNSSLKSLLEKKKEEERQFLKGVLLLALTGGLFLVLLTMLWYLNSSLGSQTASSISTLFAADNTQVWWYITRAAGLTAYFLLWFSNAWGLALSTRVFQPILENVFTFDFHEFISILGLGFTGLHVAVLFFDNYLPYNLLQILIPFTGTYRPFWVGLGIVSFYIFLLVTITFYIRQRIGTKAFRAIHISSLVGYLIVTLHGLFAGADSALTVTKLIYAVTFLILVFLTVFWFVLNRLNQPKPEPAPKPIQYTAANYSGSYKKVSRAADNAEVKRK